MNLKMQQIDKPIKKPMDQVTHHLEESLSSASKPGKTPVHIAYQRDPHADKHKSVLANSFFPEQPPPQRL